MQVIISARHGQLSDESREKIAEKLQKLPRFFERMMSIELTIDLEHEENPHVELLVSAEHKHDFVATDQSDNLIGSVDTVIHKVEQQLRKYKEKIQSRHRTNNKAQEFPVPQEPELD